MSGNYVDTTLSQRCILTGPFAVMKGHVSTQRCILTGINAQSCYKVNNLTSRLLLYQVSQIKKWIEIILKVSAYCFERQWLLCWMKIKCLWLFRIQCQIILKVSTYCFEKSLLFEEKAQCLLPSRSMSIFESECIYFEKNVSILKKK